MKHKFCVVQPNLGHMTQLKAFLIVSYIPNIVSYNTKNHFSCKQALMFIARHPLYVYICSRKSTMRYGKIKKEHIHYTKTNTVFKNILFFPKDNVNYRKYPI
jgi:hypothetical protein